MVEIKGEYNTAKVFTDTAEQDALDQVKTLCDQEFVEGSTIRLMPDMHFGKGCTIGTSMTIEDKVCPNLVGVDIGCAMLCVELGSIDIDLAKLDEICHSIPSGRNIWDGRQAKFNLEELCCYRKLKDVRHLHRSIATLGGGNHFFEANKDDENVTYFVLHTGSRNLGKQVAEIYQHIAIALDQGHEERFKKEQEIIDTYKAQGRRSEIQAALKEYRRNFRSHANNHPQDLCYVYGDYFKDYIHDMKICQEFAQLNRETYMNIVLDKLGLTPVNKFTTWHNYIDTDNMILRKGAISAQKDEIAIIPMNMRDGSLIVKGKGNPDWNYSAPHGAGRRMSRIQAAKNLDVEDFKKTMEGIYTTSVSKATLDEAPMAYKPMEEIVKNIEPTCNIMKTIKPIYNFKASN